MNISFQPVTLMQTWNIRHRLVVLHRFLFDYAAVPLFFFFYVNMDAWLLRLRLLQRFVHETF